MKTFLEDILHYRTEISLVQGRKCIHSNIGQEIGNIFVMKVKTNKPTSSGVIRKKGCLVSTVAPETVHRS